MFGICVFTGSLTNITSLPGECDTLLFTPLLALVIRVLVHMEKPLKRMVFTLVFTNVQWLSWNRIETESEDLEIGYQGKLFPSLNIMDLQKGR